MTTFDEAGDEMLQYMLKENLIITKFDRSSNEQQFQITPIGFAIMQTLKYFAGDHDETTEEIMRPGAEHGGDEIQ